MVYVTQWLFNAIPLSVLRHSAIASCTMYSTPTPKTEDVLSHTAAERYLAKRT